MSVTEILEELPKLSAEDQALVRQRLDQLLGDDFEETPAMLAAIDEALASPDEDGIPLEEVRQKIKDWVRAK